MPLTLRSSSLSSVDEEFEDIRSVDTKTLDASFPVTIVVLPSSTEFIGDFLSSNALLPVLFKTT